MYLVLVIVQIAEGYAYLMMAPCMATVRRVTGPGTWHLYNTGAKHVGFSPTKQTLLAPSAKRRDVFGDRMTGELHPTKGPLVWCRLRHLVRPFFGTDDKESNDMVCFPFVVHFAFFGGGKMLCSLSVPTNLAPNQPQNHSNVDTTVWVSVRVSVRVSSVSANLHLTVPPSFLMAR